MARHKYDYDLIVIGSGAGGSVAADIVAREGKRVAIVEADTLGGECPNWGCVPTKALLQAAHTYAQMSHGSTFGLRTSTVGYNYPSIKAWKDLAVERTGSTSSDRYYRAQGISVYHGKAHFIGAHEISVNQRHLTSDSFLVATGSHPILPAIDGIEDVPYLTPRDALDLIRPPKSLCIIGAGAVGAEFTDLFSAFGTKVYLADISPRVLPREDDETSSTVEKYFEEVRGVHMLTKSKILRVAKDGIMTRVTYVRGGHEHSIKVDRVLIAAGSAPTTDLGLENAGVEYTKKGITVDEHLATTSRHIYAAGDVLGRYAYTHTGVYEGKIVAHNLLHKQKLAPDYRAVPRVTYVTPEVASVGLSEADCIKRDLAIRKAVAPLNIIGRSNIADERDGFCKVITDKKGVLLGATVVGPNAGEIIHELTLAIHMHMTAQDVANTLHAFPSWSEIVRVACGKLAS
jgi:mercuric reductase